METTRAYRQLARAPRGRRRLRTAAGIMLLGAGLYAYAFFSILFLLSVASAGTGGTAHAQIEEATYLFYWTVSIGLIIGGVVLIVLGLRR